MLSPSALYRSRKMLPAEDVGSCNPKSARRRARSTEPLGRGGWLAIAVSTPSQSAAKELGSTGVGVGADMVIDGDGLLAEGVRGREVEESRGREEKSVRVERGRYRARRRLISERDQ